MNGTQAQVIHTHSSTETTAATGGSVLEASGAIATIALAIVGLAGIFQPSMAGIAAVVLGASVMAESGVKVAGFGRQAGLSRAEDASNKLIGGLAAVVLGILALLGIAPAILTSVSIIVLGGAFLTSGQLIAGIAGVTLGILAVCGIDPLILVLVGFLSLGAWALLSSSTTATQALSEKAA